MKHLMISLLTAALALSTTACKKKKRATSKPAASRSATTTAPSAASSSQAASQAATGSRAWLGLVSSLPLDSDALVFLSLEKLKTTPQWGLLSGLVEASKLYKEINTTCGLTLNDLPRQAAMAMAYHRRDVTVILTGPAFPAQRIMACLPKLANKQMGITWTPGGPHSGLLTVNGTWYHNTRLAAMPHRLVVTMGEAAKTQVKGQARPKLGHNAKVYGLVDRVGGTDLWLLSLGLPPAIKSRLPSTNAISQMRALALGVNLTAEGLALKLVVDMRATKTASDLAAVFKRYLPGLDRYSTNLAQLKPIFSKLHIGTDANYLTLSISLTWTDLNKLRVLQSFVDR